MAKKTAAKTTGKDEKKIDVASPMPSAKPVHKFHEEAKIIAKEQFTNDTFIFTIKTDMAHKPGQFIEISVPLYGEAPISIASHKEGQMDLLIRNVGNVTNQLCKLDVGDMMSIRGPYGLGYPMDVLKGNNVVIIAGGTGTAPVRGVIQYIEQNRKDYKDLNIFLGYRSPDMILFKKDIDAWSKKYNTILTVDNAQTLWTGKTGVVTKYIDGSGLNNSNKVVFFCGPPAMIKFAIQSLKKLGFHDDQMFVSVERNMKCGIGKCGHCMIHGKYSCKDGPVFRYDEISNYQGD